MWKAVLANKEDDIYFLLKCFIESAEEQIILKRDRPAPIKGINFQNPLAYELITLNKDGKKVADFKLKKINSKIQEISEELTNLRPHPETPQPKLFERKIKGSLIRMKIKGLEDDRKKLLAEKKKVLESKKKSSPNKNKTLLAYIKKPTDANFEKHFSSLVGPSSLYTYQTSFKQMQPKTSSELKIFRQKETEQFKQKLREQLDKDIKELGKTKKDKLQAISSRNPNTDKKSVTLEQALLNVTDNNVELLNELKTLLKDNKTYLKQLGQKRFDVIYPKGDNLNSFISTKLREKKRPKSEKQTLASSADSIKNYHKSAMARILEILSKISKTSKNSKTKMQAIKLFKKIRNAVKDKNMKTLANKDIDKITDAEGSFGAISLTDRKFSEFSQQDLNRLDSEIEALQRQIEEAEKGETLEKDFKKQDVSELKEKLERLKAKREKMAAKRKEMSGKTKSKPRLKVVSKDYEKYLDITLSNYEEIFDALDLTYAEKDAMDNNDFGDVKTNVNNLVMLIKNSENAAKEITSLLEAMSNESRLEKHYATTLHTHYFSNSAFSALKLPRRTISGIEGNEKIKPLILKIRNILKEQYSGKSYYRLINDELEKDVKYDKFRMSATVLSESELKKVQALKNQVDDDIRIVATVLNNLDKMGLDKLNEPEKIINFKEELSQKLETIEELRAEEKMQLINLSSQALDKLNLLTSTGEVKKLKGKIPKITDLNALRMSPSMISNYEKSLEVKEVLNGLIYFRPEILEGKDKLAQQQLEATDKKLQDLRKKAKAIKDLPKYTDLIKYLSVQLGYDRAKKYSSAISQDIIELDNDDDDAEETQNVSEPKEVRIENTLSDTDKKILKKVKRLLSRKRVAQALDRLKIAV